MTGEDAAVPPIGGLDAYAALAAHQLGEALALVGGAFSVLESERPHLGPGGADALRALNAGSERAQRFVDDLLDLTRANRDPIEPPPADLDRALDVALAQLSPWLRPRRMALLREPLPEAGLAPAEAERLFLHLLRAAVAADARRVQIVASDTGPDGVTLEILDDGAPPVADADPFVPFGRPRGHGPLVGAGVGLLVCRRLVERRGGNIELTRGDDRVLVTVHLPGA